MQNVWVRKFENRDYFELNVNIQENVSISDWVHALFLNAEELMSEDDTPISFIKLFVPHSSYTDFLDDYYLSIYKKKPLPASIDNRYINCLMLYECLKEEHETNGIPDILGSSIPRIAVSCGATREIRYKTPNYSRINKPSTAYSKSTTKPKKKEENLLSIILWLCAIASLITFIAMLINGQGVIHSLWASPIIGIAIIASVAIVIAFILLLLFLISLNPWIGIPAAIILALILPQTT